VSETDSGGPNVVTCAVAKPVVESSAACSTRLGGGARVRIHGVKPEHQVETKRIVCDAGSPGGRAASLATCDTRTRNPV
jgi:hypothetical protein